MVKNKGFIFLDPLKDKSLLHIFNDLKEQQTVVFDYNGKKDTWKHISIKIGVKCKKLMEIKDPLLFPSSTARNHKLGFVTRPKDVKVEIIPVGKKMKVLFDRKYF